MLKREKETFQYMLDHEEEVIKALEKHYRDALSDINMSIRIMQSDELTQSKVYQLEYQKALKKQVEGILERMHAKEYTTIQQYLSDSYKDAFVGTMYAMHGQGIPIIAAIDQNAAVKAVITDSKISEGLYNHLGIPVQYMKKAISDELTRGISSNMRYSDIARNIENITKAPKANAMNIVRTEGHRIQQASSNDAAHVAASRGADQVKQWDATLDGDTRPTHRQLDGKIVELDEDFLVGTKKAKYPGDFGDAALDCQCRCVALYRARWALDEEELETLKERAAYFKLDKTEDFQDFKNKYLKAAEEIQEEKPFTPAKSIKEAEEYAKKNGVKYADFSKLPLETANEMNHALSTLPDDVRPVFMGASNTLEQYWGGKLPRNSKQYYGVTVDVYDGIHLGPGNGYDFDTQGYMVGISSSYKTADKITAAKQAAQERYQQKYGRKWFFNETGQTTPYHEMGHLYANVKGLPDGFEADALKWAKEAGCDMLVKPSEAWAEAWAAYHTKSNPLPDYISKYIKAASGQTATAKAGKGLILFDENGIISKKISDFKQAFEAKKIRTIISPQKQARHIKGTKEFDRYAQKLAERGDYPAYIKEEFKTDDLKRLVVSKLKGDVNISEGGAYREFVTCNEVIGYYYSKPHGKYVPTKCAQVTYASGDGNIHIIPVKELKQGGE